MAQIIKYQQGGTATKKYGTFTVDGTTYDVDDEFLKQMSNHGSSLDDRVAHQFNNIIDTLRSGENVSYNSVSDELSNNVKFNVTDKQDKRLENRRSGLGSIFGGTFKGKEESARNAIHALKNFKYNKPVPEEVVRDWSNAITADYEKDDKGEYILNENKGKKYIKNSTNNLRIAERLRNLKNIANYADSDTFKGFNDMDKKIYLDLYNSYGDKGINELISRIEQGTWNNADRVSLANIGINLKSDSRKQEATPLTEEEKLAAAQREAYISTGLDPNNSSVSGLKLQKNADGTFSLGEGVDAKSIFGEGNRYINDLWTQEHNAYAPLQGWFWYNGKLIPKSIAEDTNSVFYKDLGHWRENNKNNNFGTMGINVWGSGTDPFTAYDPNKFFVPGLPYNKGDNIKFRTLQDPNNAENVIIEYYDQSSPRDVHGFVTQNGIRKLIYNTKTGKSVSADPTTGLDINYNDSVNLAKNYSERAPGYYEINIKDDDKNEFTLFRNPKDNNDVWFFKEGMEQPYKLTPQEVKEFISQGLITENAQVFNNSYNGNISRKIIEQLQNNNPLTFGKLFRNVLLNGLSGLNRSYTNNRTKNNIFIPTHQTGGRINYGKVETKDIDTSIKAKKVGDPTKAASNKDVMHGDLTKADKLQLASIAGDIGALVASIPTGGNPVAAGIGAGSSLAQFGSDVSRDGLDWGDAGNLMLNLGLDAVTLLPGVGVTGKLAKSSKLIKNGAGLIKKALLLNGSMEAYKATNNIINGKGTLDDWKALSTGLFAIKGLKNEVQNIRGRVKMSTYKGNTPKVEAKTKDVLKKEFIDAKLKEKPELAKLDGKPTEWADANGKVLDYTKAEAAIGKEIGLNKFIEAKLAAQAKADAVKTKVSNTWSSKYNPFSKDFSLNMSNRELKPIDISSMSTSELRTLGRLARNDADFALQLQNKGVSLPATFGFGSDYTGNMLYRAPVFNTSKTIARDINIPFINKTNTFNPRSKVTYDRSIKSPVVKVQSSVRSKPTAEVVEPVLTPVQVPVQAPTPVAQSTTVRRSPNKAKLKSTKRKKATHKKLNGGIIAMGKFGLKFPWEDQINIAKNYSLSQGFKGAELPKINIPKGTEWFINSNKNKPEVKVKTLGEIQNGALNKVRLSQTFGNINIPHVQTPIGAKNFINPYQRNNSLIESYNQQAINDVVNEIKNPYTYQLDTKIGSEKPFTTKEPESNTEENTEGTLSGGEGKSFLDFIKRINPDMIGGLSDFLVSSRAINKSSDQMKSAIRQGMIGSQKQMPTEFYPIFSDNGLQRLYNNRINDMRLYKSTYSDPKVAIAERYMRDANADQLKNERDTKFSEAYSQYRNNILAQKQNYANMRTQIADENKKNWYTGLAQMDMQDANKTNQQAQNVKNLIYQLRTDFATDEAERASALSSKRAIEAQNNMEAELLNTFKPQFDALPKEVRDKYNDNAITWASSTQPYKVRDIKNKNLANFKISNFNEGRRHLWIGGPKIPEMKSGGAIKKNLSFSEQSYLDQQKAVNKAVNDLNNNIIKLFLKMMS